MEKPKRNPGYLDVLKRYVLTKAGIQVVSPGDCRTIALRIEEVTGKVVSETTLKRFLGFAKKNYNFSIYTLNALCDYVGFAGWESFQSSLVSELITTRTSDTIWSDFKKKSLEVSAISLQSLKDHSGVPFQYTVSRASIVSDFEFFMEEEYSCFGLVGVAGMGKSIQMAHLAQRYFLDANAPYKDSILWLFKRGALFDFIPHDIYLEESLYEQFGLRTEFNFIAHFRQHPEAVRGKLVLMMDGFDEYLNRPDSFDRVFQQFSDLLSYVKELDWIKIVFSLRPGNWDLLRSKIEQSSFLKKQWFPGLSYQKNLNTNLHPLLPKELNRIMERAHDGGIPRFYSKKNLFSLLRYPVFLTTYFQYLDTRHPSVASVGDVLYFQLISSYLNDRVHRSHLSIEKWFLIKKLLLLSDYGRCDKGVKEMDLLNGLFEDSTHIMAYRELVKAGILQQEQKKGAAGKESFSVRFVNEPLFVYLLSTVIVSDNKDLPVAELCEKVREEYASFPQKILLLEGIFWHLLSTQTTEVLQVFSQTAFSVEEKGKLILFICDYIQSSAEILDAGALTLFIREAVSFFATHLLYINDLNKSYDFIIDHMIRLAASDTDKVNLLIIRALLSILRLDQEALYEVKTALKKSKGVNLKKSYPLHPVDLIELVLTADPGQSSDHKLPGPFESFMMHQPQNDNGRISDEKLLSYQLGGFVLQMCFASKAFLLFSEKIKGLHPQLLSSEQQPGLVAFLEMQETFVPGDTGYQPDRWLKQREPLNRPVSCRKSTCYFEVLFLLLEGERALRKNEAHRAVQYLQEGYEICKTNNYVLLQVIVALKLVRVYKLAEWFDQPVDLVREIRQETMHLSLPIREIFLQRIMMEVN